MLEIGVAKSPLRNFEIVADFDAILHLSLGRPFLFTSL